MEIRKVDDAFAVAPQLTAADMADVARAGYSTVICNRPNGEEQGQPAEAQLREAATRAGLEFHFLPVAGHNFTDEVIQEFIRLRRAATGPLLAFCRSGARSMTLETLANPEGRTIEDRLSRARTAGYDLSALRSRLS